MGTLAAACCYPPLPELLAAAMAWTPVDMRAAFQLTLLLEAIVKATRSLPEERWQSGDISSIEIIFMFKAAFRPALSLFKGYRIVILNDHTRWGKLSHIGAAEQLVFNDLLTLHGKVTEVRRNLEAALYSMAVTDIFVNRGTVRGSLLLPHDILALNGAAYGKNKHIRSGSPIAMFLNGIANAAVYVPYDDSMQNEIAFLCEAALPVVTDNAGYAATAHAACCSFATIEPPPPHAVGREFRDLAVTVEFISRMICTHVMAVGARPSIAGRRRRVDFMTGQILPIAPEVIDVLDV